jgi:transposase
MAEEQREPTAEAIKQRKKREKDAAKKAALGIEKFTIEVAGVFMPDLKRLMKEHGFNNQQEVYQNLLRNVIAADFEVASWMLRNVTTPYELSEKVLRQLRAAGLQHLAKNPGELEDTVIEPDCPPSITPH